MNKAKTMGKAIGEKIESLKSPEWIWVNEGTIIYYFNYYIY